VSVGEGEGGKGRYLILSVVAVKKRNRPGTRHTDGTINTHVGSVHSSLVSGRFECKKS